MKKIAIDVRFSVYEWDETSYVNGGVGGSEIWAIKTSDELAKRGYSVYLFGNPKETHTSNSGVRYLKEADYYYISENFDFDCFIFSRVIPYNLEKIKCQNIFIMVHDMDIFNVPIEYNPALDKIKKIFYLSEFHRQNLAIKYPFFADRLAYTRNGVDGFLYEKYNNLPKKNKMLCSSGPYRQGIWIINYVFPLIRKEVPDFEINLCHYYDNFDDEIFHQDGINIIGSPSNQITRENLIKEQCESKIWIYSNNYIWNWNLDNEGYFNETFCITALESACAKNAIIVGERSPFTETLNGYNYMVGKDLYNESLLDAMPRENLKKFADVLANEAIKCLKDEEYRLSLVNQAYPIGMKSDWINATDYIENEIKKV